jgi:hypothetical protein
MHNTPFLKLIRLSLLIRRGGIFYLKDSLSLSSSMSVGIVEIYTIYKELLMSLSLIRKPFVMQGLAITVATLMMNSTHAASEQEQIQRLRDEVKELSALLQQYVPQTKQQNDTPQVAVAPASTGVTTHNQNTPAVVAANIPKKSPLSFSAASGAEVKLYGFLRGNALYQSKSGDGIFNRINKVDLEGAEKNSGRG